MGKVIYDSRDLTTAGGEILDRVDKALVAAAFQIRDSGRAAFLQDGKMTYKHYNPTHFDPLAEGIMVGKLKKDHSVVLHALGGNATGSNLWKTRFFVGGTIDRFGPWHKGMITKLESIDKATDGAQTIVDQYINNAINNE